MLILGNWLKEKDNSQLSNNNQKLQTSQEEDVEDV